jgi:hypothetical protein
MTTYTVILEQDPETGDVILPLSNEILETIGVKENDTVNFTDNQNGTFSITKATDDITHPMEDWDSIQWECFKNWIVNTLYNTKVTITFTKKDGTERVMQCTLKPSLLPKKEVKEDKADRKKSEHTIAVYDLEAKDWRSFTLKSVKGVSFAVS